MKFIYIYIYCFLLVAQYIDVMLLLFLESRKFAKQTAKILRDFADF